MRKVSYYIDDVEYLRRSFKEENPGLTQEEVDRILAGVNGFKAVYTIIGNVRQPDRYELVDENGHKMNINDLNGYQRGVVLGDCIAHFTGRKYQFNEKAPCGVIGINVTDNEKIDTTAHCRLMFHFFREEPVDGIVSLDKTGEIYFYETGRLQERNE